MDIIVSDFDATLFKRNYGLINPVVQYLEQRGYPVYIVTFRAKNQGDFILGTLAGTKLNIVGMAFADSRKKEAYKKVELINDIATRHNVIQVLDDSEDVVLALKQQGYQASQP